MLRQHPVGSEEAGLCQTHCVRTHWGCPAATAAHRRLKGRPRHSAIEGNCQKNIITSLLVAGVELCSSSDLWGGYRSFDSAALLRYGTARPGRATAPGQAPQSFPSSGPQLSSSGLFRPMLPTAVAHDKHRPGPAASPAATFPSGKRRQPPGRTEQPLRVSGPGRAAPQPPCPASPAAGDSTSGSAPPPLPPPQGSSAGGTATS